MFQVRLNFSNNIGEQDFAPVAKDDETKCPKARGCVQVYGIGPDVVRVNFETADVHWVDLGGHDCNKCHAEDANACGSEAAQAGLVDVVEDDWSLRWWCAS